MSLFKSLGPCIHMRVSEETSSFKLAHLWLLLPFGAWTSGWKILFSLSLLPYEKICLSIKNKFKKNIYLKADLQEELPSASLLPIWLEQPELSRVDLKPGHWSFFQGSQVVQGPKDMSHPLLASQTVSRKLDWK